MTTPNDHNDHNDHNGHKRKEHNQLRPSDTLDNELYESIIRDNKKMASKASGIDEDVWADDENWNKPLYSSIEEYPCYNENMANLDKLRIHLARHIAAQKKSSQEKELALKQEYASFYDKWKEKTLEFDHTRQEKHQEDPGYNDGVVFNGQDDVLLSGNDGTPMPYPGSVLFTSNVARSEAELAGIMQTLEEAEMRHPESRAKKNAASIPPMILDPRARMRTFDDRNGLVEDPISYYRSSELDPYLFSMLLADEEYDA